MGYSGYIKINGETVMNEYKSSGDVIMAYAKAMLLRIPTKLKCNNIVKLVEDFRFIDDSVVDYDLGLQSGTDLYDKIYLEKDYANDSVAEFVTGLMVKVSKAYSKVESLFTYLAVAYGEVAKGKEITMTVMKSQEGYALSFSDGYNVEIPKKVAGSTFEVCSLYDRCNALSVEFEVTDSSVAEEVFRGFEDVEACSKDLAMERMFKESLNNFCSIEVYAGY